jgi:hypothetical protein
MIGYVILAALAVFYVAWCGLFALDGRAQDIALIICAIGGLVGIGSFFGAFVVAVIR